MSKKRKLAPTEKLIRKLPKYYEIQDIIKNSTPYNFAIVVCFDCKMYSLDIQTSDLLFSSLQIQLKRWQRLQN
jgi:hypothetical protein